jgi:tRNA modification GTPase
MREGLQKILSDDETIVAISTPLGHGGIGVIRVSGPESLNIVRRFFKPNTSKSEWTHRVALVGKWNDMDGQDLDESVVTFFQAPRSYTGEDVIEISAHGNPFVLLRIVEIIRMAGARLAAPGEFTLRAVASGKMDLIQAEAVRDFVEAQTDRQVRTALRQMEGSVSRHIKPIKDKLIDVIAHLEAGIDFAEDDVDVPSNASIAGSLQPLRTQLDEVRETFGYGKILKHGIRVSILGKPNVGKSSLFNRLVSANRAIVTKVPGTTRDVLREFVSLDGVPVCFADTAGIRNTTDEVESIGIARTFETLAESDLAVVVLDGSSELDESDRETLRRASRIPHLVVINKNDLPQADISGELNGAKRVSISAKTGQGIEELFSGFRAFLLSQKTGLNDDLVLTNARQYEAVTNASCALVAAENALATGIPHEMVLLDVYRALGALDELTGEVVTEDILDRIFSTFCIGK